MERKNLRCVILGFDGLEYNIVKKFDLKSLKQAEYGKIRIPKEFYIKVNCEPYEHPIYEPWTPLIWYSFITGRFPSEEFRRDMENLGKWNNKAVNLADRLMRKLIKIGFSDMYRVKKVLSLLGIRKRLPTTKDYNVPTIFDLTKRAVVIDVPTYTENWSFGLTASPDENLRDFINRSLTYELKRFDSLKKRVLSLLKGENWKLLMMYTKLLDTFGELSFNDKLISTYFMVNNFVGKVRDMVGDSSFILIISDHGTERIGETNFGKHSDHAFYSINIPIKLKNPKITDFFNVINMVLAAKSKEELISHKNYR